MDTTEKVALVIALGCFSLFLILTFYPQTPTGLPSQNQDLIITESNQNFLNYINCHKYYGEIYPTLLAKSPQTIDNGGQCNDLLNGG